MPLGTVFAETITNTQQSQPVLCQSQETVATT